MGGAGRLVFLRHGESQWNKENRFTGWIDIDLSEKGREESAEAARLMKGHGLGFGAIYTSVLKRAIRTAWIVQEEMDLMWVPLLTRWRLNERHYGALQGMNKDEMRKKYGEEQVFIWRRSYSVRPPQLGKSDERYPVMDPRYAGLKEKELPLGESLKDTVTRAVPCWKKEIAPELWKGKDVLVAAHGNSIRALVKHIDNVPDDEIPKFEIPTGKPLVYEFGAKLEAVKHYYLE